MGGTLSRIVGDTVSPNPLNWRRPDPDKKGRRLIRFVKMDNTVQEIKIVVAKAIAEKVRELKREVAEQRQQLQIITLQRDEALAEKERIQAKYDELVERKCAEARERMFSPAGAPGSIELYRQLRSEEV